jgi:anti-repressor protein
MKGKRKKMINHNQMQVFVFEGHDVRTIVKDGEPWWVLKDVCDLLDLADTNKVAERLDDDELTRIKIVSGGQNRDMYVVNETGLYSVILRSDKPEAKALHRWMRWQRPLLWLDTTTPTKQQYEG